MYPINIIEKRERKGITPGVVFTGREIVHLSEGQVRRKVGSFPNSIFFNTFFVLIICVAVVFLYVMPFMEMNERDRETYLQLAFIPTSAPNQQSLLSTLHSLGASTSVSNFDSNISIVTVTDFHDTRSLLSVVESFEGVVAIQNSVNGFQIKVVRGVL